MKKKIIIILTASIVFSLSLFLILFFSIPRISYKKVDNEYHIVNMYGNKKEVFIPSKHKDLPVTVIETRAFEGKKIEKLIFEDNSNLFTIERLAFNECKKITEIVFPDSLVEIDNHAFMNCTGIKKITTNDALEYIGGGAFMGCINLESITFGNCLKTIGSYAFYECESLTIVEIPINCKNVYNNSFSYCKMLEKIYGYKNTTFDPKMLENSNAKLIIIE